MQCRKMGPDVGSFGRLAAGQASGILPPNKMTEVPPLSREDLPTLLELQSEIEHFQKVQTQDCFSAAVEPFLYEFSPVATGILSYWVCP